MVHHHAQQDVHDSLLLGVRKSDIGEGQREDVEELPSVELDQRPEVRVQRLVDGTGWRVEAGQTVQHAGTDYCNALARNVAKRIRSSRQAAADVYQDLIAKLNLNTVITELTFTLHPTQNSSFRRRSSQPTSWLSTEN